MRKKIFVLGQLEQPRQNTNLLYRHYKPNKPTKEGPVSFELFESPFPIISTGSRGHPSLVCMRGAKFYFPAQISFLFFHTGFHQAYPATFI
jgi:hypothetical protein